MNDYGYISAQFYKSDINLFKDMVDSVCHQNDFYHSDAIDYIQGNVSSKLHLTLFYGLLRNKENCSKIIDQVNNTDVKHIQLGKLFLIPGYKNLYQILCVEVLDKNEELKNFSDKFKQFKYENSVQFSKFKPHLTLAYVKPSYKLKIALKYPDLLKIKKISYFKK